MPAVRASLIIYSSLFIFTSRSARSAARGAIRTAAAAAAGLLLPPEVPHGEKDRSGNDDQNQEVSDVHSSFLLYISK